MPAPESTRLLIKARWIIPVVPENRVFEHCALAINNGVITALLPQAEADKRFHAEQVINLGNHALLPGLVNAHGQAAMSLLRGYADDCALPEWQAQHIHPAEHQWLSEDFVRDGASLAMAEMIKSGTTCFADSYFYPEQTAQAAHQAHMRCQVNFPVLDLAGHGGQDPEDYLARGLALRDDFRSNSLVRIGFGPGTLADQPLEKIAVLAQELDAPVQMRLHHTAQELQDSLTRYGLRPLERLQRLGLLSPLLQCVHMTQLEDSDIALLQQSGAQVIHCPQANLKLASGFCPVQRLWEAGVNVALGTDSAACNNDLDLFAEINTAALLAKAVAGNAQALNAHSALRMATLNGAKALGLEETIGSLEVGKAADLTAVDLSGLATQPLYNPATQLVYTGCGHRVSHVWVAGRALLLSGQLQTLNERELIAKARWWRQQISP